MQIAKVISALVFLVMLGMLIYGLAVGDFFREGVQIAALPWGQATLVDVFIGLTLFSIWVVYRERSRARSLIWIVLLFALGNLTSALYVFMALQKSGGDWNRFFHGQRANAK
jgi:hypothetical protein